MLGTNPSKLSLLLEIPWRYPLDWSKLLYAFGMVLGVERLSSKFSLGIERRRRGGRLVTSWIGLADDKDQSFRGCCSRTLLLDAQSPQMNPPRLGLDERGLLGRVWRRSKSKINQ